MVQATSAQRKLAIDKMKNWMLQECQQRNLNKNEGSKKFQRSAIKSITQFLLNGDRLGRKVKWEKLKARGFQALRIHFKVMFALWIVKELRLKYWNGVLLKYDFYMKHFRKKKDVRGSGLHVEWLKLSPKQFDYFLNLEHSIRMKYDDMFFPNSYDKMFNFHQTCYPNEVNFKHD